MSQTVVAAGKKASRAMVTAALKALRPTEVVKQSAAVLNQLRSTRTYREAKRVSIYLPLDGDLECDTWPIVKDLLAQGSAVAVPRVVGQGAEDMQMVRIQSVEQARAFPKTKWGIPEPTADQTEALGGDCAASMGFDMVLVPGVAFDARCNRLGHGRGYYDAFIRQRREEGCDMTVVGLALSCQIINEVPVAEGGQYPDQPLDMVVSPDGLNRA
jgi:5-formyltetrahydrofolate cyclo-ligase